MSTYWVNFIRSGNPNGDGLPEFRPTTSKAKQTMWLGNSWGIGPLTMNNERILFLHKWTSTLPAW